MQQIRRMKDRYYRAFIIIGIILTVSVSVYAIVTGRHYFTRRNIRLLGRQINAYGPWAPFVAFFLIVISTLIPPLPLPIPVIEIASGMMFGFLPAVALVWISQMVASIAAYFVAKHIGQRMFAKILNNPFINFYRKFIDKRGAFAVFIIRAVIAAPFNISYVAGLTRMDNLEFAGATALGVIPEVSLFVYIGVLIQYTRIRLWYVLVLLVALGVIPLLTSMIIKLLQRRAPVGSRSGISIRHA
jgi:uncharacterized membrane protein YdjX (TVP38/TMEM64 family)